MTNIRWKSLNRPELGIANRISALFARRAWSAPDCFPRFRDTKQLIIACDYSGDAKQYNFRSQTFLMVDGGALWHWDRLRLRLRADCFKEPRRISFKNVTERQRAAALVPFLRAANTLPGVLFTLLVDKRIGSVFQSDDTLDDGGASLWRRMDAVDRRSRERLFLMAHSVGLLLSGFSYAGQDVLIISDEDAMFANDQRHRLACELLACVGSHYLTHILGRLQVCTTRSDTGRLDLEDLAAIPDLAGGALSECAGVCDGRGGFTPGVLRPVDRSQSEKARAILAWYAEGWHPLKRIAVLLEKAPEDRIIARLLNIVPEAAIPEYNWRRADAQ